MDINNEDFITEYMDAFNAANPQSVLPEIRKASGWYYLKGSGGYEQPYRKKHIVQMTTRLRARVARKEPAEMLVKELTALAKKWRDYQSNAYNSDDYSAGIAEGTERGYEGAADDLNEILRKYGESA